MQRRIRLSDKAGIIEARPSFRHQLHQAPHQITVQVTDPILSVVPPPWQFEAAQIRAFLEKSGTVIGPYDVQLAGQALAKKLIFVTHNTGEFNRIPGFIVEDWAV